LGKAKEYAEGGLFPESLKQLREAAGSCVGEGGIPESRYRCLYNIFEKNVQDRAKEFMRGSPEERVKMGLATKDMMEKEISDLNAAFIVLQGASAGEESAMKDAVPAIQQAMHTNENVESMLQLTFGINEDEPKLHS